MQQKKQLVAGHTIASMIFDLTGKVKESMNLCKLFQAAKKKLKQKLSHNYGSENWCETG